MFFTPELGQSDIFHLNYPFKSMSQQSLRQGKLPLWEPGVANGLPMFAEGQIGFLYLPNLILFGLLPMWLAWNLTYVFGFLVCILGTYALARFWKLSPLAATFSAAIFGFSSFFSLHIIHHAMFQVATLLPLLILSTQLILSYYWKLGFYATIFVLSQQMLAGHPPYLFISFVGATFLFMFQLWKEKRKQKYKTLIKLSLAVILAVGIGSIQLLPTWEYIQNSSLKNRLNWEYVMHFDFPWKHFTTLITPDAFGHPGNGSYFTADLASNSIYWENTIFIGWVGLALSFYSLTRWKNYRVKSLVILAVFAALIVPGKHSPANVLFYMPIFQLFRIPSRYQILMIFSLSLLAGFGLQALRRNWKTSFSTIVLLVVLGIGQIYYFSWKQNPVVPFQEMLSQPEVLEYIEPQSRIITDYSQEQAWLGFYINQGWSQGLEPYFWLRNGLAASSNLLFDVNQLRAYAGIGVDRSDLLYQTANLDQLAPFADYTISTTQTPKLVYATVSGELKSNQKGLPTYLVHRHVNSAPEFFLTASYSAVASIEAATQELPQTADLIDTPLIETTYLKKLESDSQSIVKLKSHTKTQAQFSTQSQTDQWLIWQQTFYPGWKAYIDGKKAVIAPANISFQSVLVPQGIHEVTFIFDPTSVKVGIITSVFTLLMTILSLKWLDKLE